MMRGSALLGPVTLALAASAAASVFVLACGSSTDRAGEFSSSSSTSSSASSSGSSSGASTSSSGSLGGTSTSSSSGSSASCAAATTLVYVVSSTNDLYQFTPNGPEFTHIGTLECPSDSGATPNSMAVDRSGTAWVNFSDGTLFAVSTTDASCKATSFQAGQHGFNRFGMAFATNGAGSTDETLYVVGIEDDDSGKGLGKIDLTTMTLTTIGDFSGSLKGKGAELTGTGDGRLFGFFTTEPDATLAQIDTTSGATSNVSVLDGVETGEAWAFSFWGGDFYFYTSQNLEASKVTKKATSSDGSISTTLASVGDFAIVGAGVSTCAPTTPPK